MFNFGSLSCSKFSPLICEKAGRSLLMIFGFDVRCAMFAGRDRCCRLPLVTRRAAALPENVPPGF
jgi:hypothetical protein